MIEDARSLLRQQILFTRFFTDALATSESTTQKRALVQASVRALELGLLAYARAIFGEPGLRSLQDISELVPAGFEDYRGAELQSLVSEEGSWLCQIARAADSCLRPAPTSSRPRALIASSSSNDHWSALSQQTLQSLIGSTAELLDRHSKHDQEY